MSQKTEKQLARMLNTLKCLTINKAKAKVAGEFQRMVRWEHAAKNGGLLHCCTCDFVASIAGHGGRGPFDSGHFIPGRRAALIFHPLNCFPQCVPCNRHNSGRPDRYLQFMLDTFGQETVDELKRLANVDAKFTHEKLLELQLQFMARTKAAKQIVSQM